jgi:hypothetical protein
MVSLRSAYYGAADDLRTSGVDKEKRKRFKAAVTQGVDPDLRRNRRFLGSNAGVSLRNARDRVGENGLSDSQRSEMALRVKAKIYERISRGELPQDSEHVLVDFVSKGWETIDLDRDAPAEAAAVGVDSEPLHSRSLSSVDMQREEERQRWEAEQLQEIEQGVLHTLKAAVCVF